MRKRVFAFSSIGAAAIVVAGALFWTFYYAEVLRIRDLSIRAVDLTRVPGGRHSASFESPLQDLPPCRCWSRPTPSAASM
ncbi:MAG: hypothetical protein MZV70_10515 [Desulfobacterales bacterium]|nr:hypothetical protein [Desulfobacterales bacterium]